jgi:hypothetical protein
MRIEYNGDNPFAIHEMRATPTGFHVSFTEPVDLASVKEDSFSFERFTYQYSSKYGGDEILKKPLPVSGTTWGDDGKSVRIDVADRAAYYVHELQIKHLTDRKGRTLEHGRAYYTLNQIPKG